MISELHSRDQDHPLAVYLAGPISGSLWREDIIYNLHYLWHGLDGTGAGAKWPFAPKAILDYFTYCGPYYVAQEHDSVIEHNIDEGHDTGNSYTRRLIINACESAIAFSDLVIAYIDRLDSFGTLIELGMARAFNARIQVFISENYLLEGQGIWFAEELSWSDPICTNDIANSILEYLKQFIPNSKINYHEYIASSQWKAKANAAKERAGHRCQLCNKAGNNGNLNAHHRTYERLGDELPEDLIVLCKDCHAKFHNKVTP